MKLERSGLTRRVAVLATVACLAVGCTSGGSGPSTGSPAPGPSAAGPPGSAGPSQPVAGPSASAGPSLNGGPSAGATTVELTEADHGTVATLAVGQTVSVVLHSTYWSGVTSSDESVLAPAGAPAVSPAPPGTCLPGIGCGTVTSSFVARAPGRVVVSAGRTVCGEARSCSSPDARWEAVIEVRGQP